LLNMSSKRIVVVPMNPGIAYSIRNNAIVNCDCIIYDGTIKLVKLNVFYNGILHSSYWCDFTKL
jgi:hypothetical protein